MTAVPADIDEKFKVAVVDFGDPDAPCKFTQSLKTTGFAVITNHPVASPLIEEVYDEWRSFMKVLHEEAVRQQEDSAKRPRLDDDNAAAPSNLSEKYFRRLDTQEGYFPMASSEKAKGASVKDLKHYFQCYFPSTKYPEEVSDKAQKLWSELVALGKQLVNWIDEYMPPDIKATIQEKIGEGRMLSDCVSDTRTMLRILHYPGYKSGEEELGAVRAAAHEDINLITVLPAGSSRGLQVKSNQSGEWYEVPMVRGSIVINIGDMLQEMCDGAYISTTHRVVKVEEDGPKGAATDNSNGGAFLTNDRMSTPCFIHLKKKCPVSKTYGSAEHYLRERLVTLGVVPPAVLDGFIEEHPGGVMPGWDPAEDPN